MSSAGETNSRKSRRSRAPPCRIRPPMGFATGVTGIDSWVISASRRTGGEARVELRRRSGSRYLPHWLLIWFWKPERTFLMFDVDEFCATFWRAKPHVSPNAPGI